MQTPAQPTIADLNDAIARACARHNAICAELVEMRACESTTCYELHCTEIDLDRAWRAVLSAVEARNAV